MVWPGMNQVLWIDCSASSRTSRSVPTIPKSPREIIVGEVTSRTIAPEVLSRSKVRQTKCCAIKVSPTPRFAASGERGLNLSAELASHLFVGMIHQSADLGVRQRRVLVDGDPVALVGVIARRDRRVLLPQDLAQHRVALQGDADVLLVVH